MLWVGGWVDGWVGGWVRACMRARVGGGVKSFNFQHIGIRDAINATSSYLTSEKRSQNILKNSRYSVNKGLSIRLLDMSILSFLVLNIDFQLMK